MELIPAESLKKMFDVYAHFYYAGVGNERFLMRREARIVRKGKDQAKVDAVIVMVNPGSCTPACELVDSDKENEKLLPATPDQTQYQLMNLMDRLNWDVLKIVNLSDICEGNLDEFHAIERKFNSIGQPHSIFQAKNESERIKLLSNDEHLIFAWGGGATAKRLAKEFGLFDKNKPLKSYEKTKMVLHSTKFYPLHPRQALKVNKIKWLNDITPLFKEVLTYK